MKKITVTLSTQSVQNAINELKQYSAELTRKTALLRARIGENIAWSAAQGFSSAIASDVINGAKQYADVNVSVDDSGDTTIVIADGKDAVFIEFGAGVYNNGAVGSSPHPKGAELGFTIGSYDKGNGKKAVWGFYIGDKLVLTHGAPAAMPMYRGFRDACEHITEIAREVFGT